MIRYLIFLFLVSRVCAQETLFREVLDPKTDTHVEVVALFSKGSPGGFLPVRVKVANNLEISKSIRLSFESTTNYSNGTRGSSEFSFTAPAGKTITRDIYVPLAPNTESYGSQGSLRAMLSGSMGSSENNSNTLSNSDPAVLLSDALFTPNGSALDAAMSKSGSRGSQEFSSKFTPGMLPDSWLAYSGYDSIIMTDRDWTGTPSGAKNAILSWLRLGGQMIIFNTSTADFKSLGIPEDLSFGSAKIKPIGSDLKLDPASTLALVSNVAEGNPNKPRTASLGEDFHSSWPLQAHFGSQTFRYGLFIAVLILFAIIVGPVNLFVFAKSGQRHKLFITTPIISLVASLILIVLIIVQDGFGGSGMRRILMEVRPDGDENAAYLHQEQFCRTGVLTKSRFELNPASVFTPVPIAQSRWSRYSNSGNRQGNFSAQPNDGKLNAFGDWFQSRSEHGHYLTTIVSTRGRIEKTEASNSLISTFDFPIKSLFYLDENEQWFRADDISTGKRFQLTEVNDSLIEKELKTTMETYSTRNQKTLERIHRRPGYYIALTDAAPGIATHPGIRWKETQTVITGPVFTQ
jgi:hypothetical protein